MVECLFYRVSLVNILKYSHNCKDNGVYMVKVYDLVAISYIINLPFDNESTKTSNGHVSCRYVGKKSSPNSMSGKIIIQLYNM